MINDDDVRDSFESAYAQYLATTRQPGYQAPEAYSPRPTPHWRRDAATRELNNVEEAFRRIESADAYEHRLLNPITTTEGVQHVWDLYKHRYGLWGDRARNQLSFEQLAQCALSMLQWHDVFNAVDDALTKKEKFSESYESTVKVPAEYILEAAQKLARTRHTGRHRRTEAIGYLRDQGIDYDSLTEGEKQEWRARAREEKAYVRTYL